MKNLWITVDKVWVAGEKAAYNRINRGLQRRLALGGLTCQL